MADTPSSSAAVIAPCETLGDLRVLTEGLPDETVIAVNVRVGEDEFYPWEYVEKGSAVDMRTSPPTLELVINDPRPWDA